jgi:predicted amidohydrolase YtcJ
VRLPGIHAELLAADNGSAPQDPHKVDPQKIKDIRIVRTVVGGRTVHPKADS